MPTYPVSSAGAAALTFIDGQPSVLVRDVMAASTFESSDAFHELSPAVTVVLPTFRRGDSGLLSACIDSVLAQTFRDFELIIIDDGSTDSTRRIIEGYLASDSRVATIRHPANIGLPGLSCNEAILQARGQKVFFTFDDNTLNPDGLETMINAAAAAPDRHFLYGEVFAPYPGHDRTEGTGEFSLARLHEQNFIPNGAVLIDRQVFDRCGLYDPHILLTRRCDWDLWLRVSQVFDPLHVKKLIATENGRTQVDSLGNSHTWDAALAEEWMATDRIADLRPNAFPDYNIAGISDELTELSRAKILAYAQRFFGRPRSEDAARTGYLLLICEAVSADLRAGFLENQEAVRVVCITYFQVEVLALWDLLLGARRVIFTGSVVKAEAIAARLRTIGKAYDYCFLGPSAGDDRSENARSAVLRGAGHVIRRPEGDSAHALEARPAATWKSSEDVGWTRTTLGELYAEDLAPDMLDYSAMADAMMRTVEVLVEVTEVVPEGYYTSAEFASRLRHRVRRHPLSLFRLAGWGFRILRSPRA